MERFDEGYLAFIIMLCVVRRRRYGAIWDQLYVSDKGKNVEIDTRYLVDRPGGSSG